MKHRLRRICLRAGITSFAAVLLSLALFVLGRLAIGVPIDTLDLIEVLIIPAVVAFPIASYIFLQSEKLEQAYLELARLHDEMENAQHELTVARKAVGYAESHDPLTGVLNRENLLELLRAACERGARDAFLVVDADNLEHVNDAVGHLQGDQIVRQLAKTIQQLVRPGDIVGRLGGGEFGILLNNASAATAADVAEAIRLRVASIVFSSPNEGPMRLSASIGGAVLADNPADVAHVLAHVRRCVSRAKLAGRNRIAFNYALSDVAFGMARSKRRLS